MNNTIGTKTSRTVGLIDSDIKESYIFIYKVEKVSKQ